MMPQIGLIEYGVTNIGPLYRTMQSLNLNVSVVSVPRDVKPSTSILVLPGVGSYDFARDSLRKTGLDQAILEYHNGGGKIFGICLGLQLLCTSSEEGKQHGLDLMPFGVKKIDSIPGCDKKVNNGWRKLSSPSDLKETGIFTNLLSRDLGKFYFSHSFSLSYSDIRMGQDASFILLQEGTEIVAAVSQNRIAGVQFHPERSHSHGHNFLDGFFNSWLLRT